MGAVLSGAAAALAPASPATLQAPKDMVADGLLGSELGNSPSVVHKMCREGVMMESFARCQVTQSKQPKVPRTAQRERVRPVRAQPALSLVPDRQQLR